MEKKVALKKKIVSVCLVLALCAVVVSILAMSYSGYRGVVKEALRIHYGWESEEHLQDIATKAFMDQLGGDSFTQGRKLYFVASVHLQPGEGYDLRENEILVEATIYNPDIMYAIFTLVKTEDGKYLIQDVEYDI